MITKSTPSFLIVINITLAKKLEFSIQGSNSSNNGDIVFKGTYKVKPTDKFKLSDLLNPILEEFGIPQESFHINFDFEIERLSFSFDYSKKALSIGGKFKLDENPESFKLTYLRDGAGNTILFKCDFNVVLPIPKNLPVVHSQLSDNLQIRLKSLVIASAKSETYPAGISIDGHIKFFDFSKDININVFNKQTKHATRIIRKNGLEIKTPTNKSKSPIKWFNINKKIGPISLQKIGFEFSQGQLSLLIDVSATMGGLSFSLDGLSISSPLKFPPQLKDLTFGIDGISVAYHGESISLGGGFIKSPILKDYYSGLAFIETEKFSIDAIGGYGKDSNGDTSLFIFGSIDIPIGGPPIFYVTGLSLGFGYNMSLILPQKAADIPNFPLLDTQLFTGIDASKVGQALEKVDKDIYPSPNDYWFAIGVHFKSFDLIQSQVLLTVDIQKEIISILGLSKLVLPKGDADPFVNVSLGIIVSYNIKEGILRADAAIGQGSYILDKGCKIFGEFAFYAWFKGEHAGNFVLSLGGYHPKFIPPAYYPTVQRVGFDWRISDKLDIGGSTYFALTPSSIMAGIKFHLTFSAGSLKASLKADADFLVQWKPFHYTIFVSIEIGVSYECFKLDMGAFLQIDGPPFAGKVHVDWTVISFTIHFGKKASKPNLLAWKEFHTAFLPSEPIKSLPKKTASIGGAPIRSSVNRITIARGLLKKIPNTNSFGRNNQTDKIWVVRADELTFSTQSKIPNKSITFGKHKEAIPSQSIPYFINNEATLGARPMGLRGLQKAAHNISFTGPTGGNKNDPTKLTTWEWAVQNIGVPEAIWSSSPVNPMVPKAKVIETTIGLSKISPKSYDPGKGLSAKIAAFKAVEVYNKIYLSDQTDFISTVGTASSEAYSTIRNTFSSTIGKRNTLISQVNQIFGLTGSDSIKEDTTNYLTNLEAYLVGEPELGAINYHQNSVNATSLITKPVANPTPTSEVASVILSKAWIQESNKSITDYTATQQPLFYKNSAVYVYPGLSYLFDLVNPGNLNAKLSYQSSNRLQLLCFDEYYQLITCELSNQPLNNLPVGGTGKSSPNNFESAQLCLTSLNPSSNGIEVHGWSSAYQLQVINPNAVLGTGFILKTQTPIYNPTNAMPYVSSILEANKIGETGDLGWVDTNFLISTTQQIIVLFKYIGTGTAPANLQLADNPINAVVPYLIVDNSGAINKKYIRKNLVALDITPNNATFSAPNLNGYYGVLYDISTIKSWKGLVFRGQIKHTQQEAFQLYGIFGLNSPNPIPTGNWQTIDYIQATNDFEAAAGNLLTLNANT